MLFHGQRTDLISQLRAMCADVMHGQNIKHRCYTPDIRIRLNNSELTEAVVPDCLQIFFCFRSAQSLSFSPWFLTLFRNASLFHGFASRCRALQRADRAVPEGGIQPASRAAVAARHALPRSECDNHQL